MFRRPAAPLVLALAVAAWSPASAQSSGAVGLPPASSMIGVPHRGSDGSIVIDPAGAAPPAVRAPSAPAAPVPPVVSKPTVPSVGRPAAAAAAPSPPIAAGPDAIDDATCRAYAWLPGMTSESCRRDLKAAHAKPATPLPSPAAAPPPAAAAAKPEIPPPSPAAIAAAKPELPAASPPPAAPRAPAIAAGPDAIDDATCRAYAWLPGMTDEGCRRDVKAARAKPPG